jgi:molybdopterin adenylyltransferase
LRSAAGAATGDSQMTSAPAEPPMRAAIVTISTSRSAGEGEDIGGSRLAELAQRLGAQIAGRDLIPDDRPLIEERLRHWSDVERCELVLTTGGTGFAPSDITPEATRAVIEREAPGIAEAMRHASREHTSHWMLSRGVAGIRGSSLIVNFPGSPESIEQAGAAIEQALPHAANLIAGRRSPH